MNSNFWAIKCSGQSCYSR